jgi:hypothetical protein
MPAMPRRRDTRWTRPSPRPPYGRRAMGECIINLPSALVMVPGVDDPAMNLSVHVIVPGRG